MDKISPLREWWLVGAWQSQMWKLKTILTFWRKWLYPSFQLNLAEKWLHLWREMSPTICFALDILKLEGKTLVMYSSLMSQILFSNYLGWFWRTIGNVSGERHWILPIDGKKMDNFALSWCKCRVLFLGEKDAQSPKNQVFTPKSQVT